MTLAKEVYITQKNARPISDTWIPMAWDEFEALVTDPSYDKTKCYYYNGHMRLEMPPVSHDHAETDGTITLAVNLFGIAQKVPFKVLGNCSYRKSGSRNVNRMCRFIWTIKLKRFPLGLELLI